MKEEIGKLLFDAVRKLVLTALAKRFDLSVEGYLTRRKVEGRLDDSIAKVIEQLLPFLENEHVTDHQREVLLYNLDRELEDILAAPEELFASSLNGQKVFDRRYSTRPLPEGIRNERMDDLYALIFPQVANLLCAYPPALEAWKAEAFRDGFRRLDEIAESLGGIAGRLDGLASRQQGGDDLLPRVRQSLARRVEFQLDLTGLRGDRPDVVPLEKCYIVPELAREVEDDGTRGKRRETLTSDCEMLAAFGRTKVRALVQGAPGSGKSSWARWLQRLELAEQEAHLAVVVRLRDLPSDGPQPSLQQILREAAGVHLQEELTTNAVREWCLSGSVTLILDGFDEVPPHRRGAVLSWIRDLDAAMESAGLVLTSRPLTTDHLLSLRDDWVRWDLSPFDEPRVAAYISRWYAHAPLLPDGARVVDAERLTKEWLADPVLRPLVGNPLMLVTLLTVHHLDGELPKGRALLYERYVDGMLGLWDARRKVPATIDLVLEQKKRILTRIALGMHLVEAEQLDDAEMAAELERTLSELGCTHPVKVVLDYLRERSGLLIGPGTWSFVHKSVAEFLVAAAVRDGDQVDSYGQKLDRLRLFEERYDDRWNTILFLWAGLATPSDLQGFIEQVLAEPGDGAAALGLGLLHDQMQPYRLPGPWRDRQVLALLRRGSEAAAGELLSGTHEAVFSFEVSWKEGRLPLGLPRVRSVEGAEGRQALRRLLRASNLSWAEASYCHDSLRPLVWLDYATNLERQEEMRRALRSWAPGSVPSEAAVNVAFSWSLAAGIRGRPSSGTSVEDVIELFCEACPSMSGRVILLLIFRLLEDLSHRVGLSRPEETAAWFEALLQAIHNRRETVVDTGYVNADHRGQGFLGKYSVLQGLEQFPAAVREAICQGRIADSDAARGAVELAQNLLRGLPAPEAR